MCSRFELLLMPCRFRSLSHRCFSGSGWVFKIQIFLLHHGIYHLTWCNLRSIYMRFPLSLRMVPGSAAQDTRQKFSTQKLKPLRYLKYLILLVFVILCQCWSPIRLEWAIPSSANTYALRVYWKVPSHFLLAMQLSGRHLANYLLLKASSLLRLWC